MGICIFFCFAFCFLPNFLGLLERTKPVSSSVTLSSTSILYSIQVSLKHKNERLLLFSLLGHNSVELEMAILGINA